MIVSAWPAIAGGGWLFLKHGRDMRLLRYFDLVVFPFYPDRFHQALGQHHLSQAQDRLAAGEFNQAVFLFRAGLARLPEHKDARLTLARLYVAGNRPSDAASVLEQGIPHHLSDRDYADSTLRFFSEYHDDQGLLRVADRLIQESPPEIQALAYEHAVLASVNRGDLDGAEALIKRAQFAESSLTIWLQAHLEHSRGRPQSALVAIEQALASGLFDDRLFALASAIYRELGNFNALEKTARLRLVANPLSPQPRLDLLAAHHLRGHITAASIASAQYLQLFNRDQTALLALGDFAATHGLPVIARHVESACRNHGWPTDRAALMTIEALIVSGHYREGLERLETHLNEAPDLGMKFATTLESLRTVARFALHDRAEAELSLNRLLQRPDLRPLHLNALGERLVAIGAHDLARSVFARIVEREPRNLSALRRLVPLELAQASRDNLPGHLRQLMQFRERARPDLQLALAELGRDRHLLWHEQARLLNELQQSLPIDGRRN